MDGGGVKQIIAPEELEWIGQCMAVDMNKCDGERKERGLLLVLVVVVVGEVSRARRKEEGKGEGKARVGRGNTGKK